MFSPCAHCRVVCSLCVALFSVCCVCVSLSAPLAFPVFISLYFLSPQMASLSVRDAIVVLLLLWIPASLYLLFNHTTSVRTELRKDLLRQMREDHELMAPHEFTPGGVHSPGLRAGAATAVLPKAPAPRKPAGWPTDPLYDPTNRAVTVEDLDLVEFNEASWLEIAQALHEKNRWMLETGA